MSFIKRRCEQLRMSTESGRLQFEVAPHSTGHGYRYEEACLALALLRCMRAGLRFALSANDAAGGKFDDLVLCWSGPDSAEAALFVQLKHTTSAKYTSIRRSTLLAGMKGSKDFSIDEYHKSYKNIRDSLEGGSYSLVLYTNLGLNEDAQDMVVERSPGSVAGLERLDSGGRLYSLNPDNDDVKRVVQGDDQFLQHFYMFCNQSSNNSIRDQICAELELTLGADESSCRRMCDSLCSSIREWMSAENICITDSWGRWLDIVDAYVKEKVTTCNSTVTRLEYTDVEALRAYVEGHNPAWVRPPGRRAAALTATRVHQAVRAERHIVARLAGLREAALRCWGPLCPWLVLVDDDEQSYDNLLQLEKQVGPNRRLVIVSYKGDSSYMDTCKASDIDDASWKKLMDVNIKLNSEQHVCRLEDLCDRETLKAMLDGNPEAVAALSQLSGSVRMGQDMERLPQNHIPRQLRSRAHVTEEILSSLGYKEVCIMDKVTYNFVTNKTVLKNTVKFEELENSLKDSHLEWPLFVVGTNVDHSVVQMICNRNEDLFLYILSIADDEQLYIEEHTRNLLQVVDGCSNQVIVEGKPGVGKSTMLTDMARQLKEKNPTWWILRINLSECSEVFNSCNSSAAASKAIVLRAVYSEKNLGELEHALLQHCLLHYPRIICLVDGFDEICPDYAEKCLQVVQQVAPRRGRLVVTTRPSVTGLLEAALGVLAHSLPEFSDQQLGEFHGRPLSEISVTGEVKDLLKIPLFSRMYVESLGGGNTVGDIVSLYEAFFERKFRRLYEDKWGDDLSKSGKRRKFQREQMEHQKQLGFLAMSDLFPRMKVPHRYDKSTIDRDDLVKAGIIYQFIHDKPIFIHRTFAEHFLAKWCFLDVADSLRAIVYCRAISDSRLEFFVETFDRIASRDRPFLKAVLNGTEAEVKSLLDKGANPVEVDKFGRSSLHLAAAYSRDSTLPELLVDRLEVVGAARPGGSALGTTKGKRGSVPKVNRKRGTTESVRAAGDSRLAKISRAAAAQETVGAPGPQQSAVALAAEDGLLGWTLLRYAAERRRWRAVSALLEAGAQLRHLGGFQRGRHQPAELWRVFQEGGYLALCDRILGKDGSPSDFLLQERRDQHKRCLEIKVGLTIVCVQMSYKQYQEILQEAHIHGNIEVVKLICRKIDGTMRMSEAVGFPAQGLPGGSPLEESGRMPLREARLAVITLKEAMDKRLASVLQQVGVGRNVDGAARLGYAARIGDAQLVRKLIEAGIDANMRMNGSLLAVHLAAWFGHADCIRCLHSAGAAISATDEKGTTPLHFAAWMGRKKAVKLLLDAGADALMQNSQGRTPLHLAAMAANAECVRLLACAVNNLELPDRDGHTALHYAASNRDVETVKVLLDAGTRNTPASGSLATPLHLAAAQGSAECVRLLLQAGADVAQRDAHGRTALHCVAGEGSPDCVRELLRAGADLQERDEAGATPLHFAAYWGRAETVRALLDAGADVLARDSRSAMPLHLATVGRHEDCVRLLTSAGRG